jgi:hypothetical protein
MKNEKSLTRRNVGAIPVWTRLHAYPCLPSFREDAAIVGHHVGLFVDHAQEQVGIARSVCADNQSSLRQNLLQEWSVSLSEIDQIDWPTQPDRKLFDQLDSNLWVERRGRSYGKVQIAVSMAVACRQGAEEDRHGDRGMASQDLSNRSLNRGVFLRGYLMGVMGLAHLSSVITNGLQAQGKEGEAR